jgi:Rrf2 family iron-sulfur cluster assembly transcriptional regulator
MIKLYSKGCQYAMSVLAYVTEHHEEERFSLKEVCEEVDLPEFFTRKIFQDLVQARLIRAHRGPGGGYSLARPAGQISLLELIYAIEGEDAFDHCIMGLAECGSEKPCPLHEVWAASRIHILERLRDQTLVDLRTSTLGCKGSHPSRKKRTRKNSAEESS